MRIGERIRDLRKKSVLSQAGLGELAGVESNTVSRWERGELTPRGTSLARIARALNTTSAYLLGETDDPSIPKNILSVDTISGNDNEQKERRLIIKNKDMYVNLPETSEGLDLLRRFFDIQKVSNAVVVGG